MESSLDKPKVHLWWIPNVPFPAHKYSLHANTVCTLTQFFLAINLFSFFHPFLGLPSDFFASISAYTLGYIFHVFHACYIFSRFILLHSVAVTVCREWCQLCRSSLFSLLHSPVHVGFVADKVALVNFYLVLQICPVSVKTALLHTLPFIPYLWRHIKLATDSVVEWNSPTPSLPLCLFFPLKDQIFPPELCELTHYRNFVN